MHDDDLVKRFEYEGQHITQINNSFPNAPVVKVFEYGLFGTNPRIPYTVMEILKGPSLLDEIKKQKQFKQDQALWICKRIAEALLASHKNFIYHRDVSPDNVIVIPPGREKMKSR